MEALAPLDRTSRIKMYKNNAQALLKNSLVVKQLALRFLFVGEERGVLPKMPKKLKNPLIQGTVCCVLRNICFVMYFTSLVSSSYYSFFTERKTATTYSV